MADDRWPLTKPCPTCGHTTQRKPLFTSYYYACWYCDPPEPPKQDWQEYKPDFEKGSGVIHLPPGFTVKGFDSQKTPDTHKAYPAKTVNAIYAPKPTHRYVLNPSDLETHFHAAGDVLQVNGGTPYTVQVDGYYNIDGRGHIIRL